MTEGYRYSALGADEHDDIFVVENETSGEILRQMKAVKARAYFAIPVKGAAMKGGMGANALYRVERGGMLRNTNRRGWFERMFRYYELGGHDPILKPR